MQEQSVSLRFCCKKGVLKNFLLFRGKHLCPSFSFDKVACFKPADYYVFSFEFCKVFKTTYFVEYEQSAASGNEYPITSH